MDNKRKSTSAADGDDRGAKRRKPSANHNSNDPNLMLGETPETTTHYGLKFLEMLRRTSDKSGRLVATYFEDLLPRASNEDYYERIKMPISLKTIEQKLHNRDFKDMTELESYFKRMVVNVKEYYARNSQTFDDSERVRKAISNFMVKTNPAYRGDKGYSAQPTPIPVNSQAEPQPKPTPKVDPNGDADADAEGEEDETYEKDAEGEDDAGNEEDAAGENEEDAESEVGTGRIRIRRKPSRHTISLPSVSGAVTPQLTFVPTNTAPDHQFEGVPYSKLNFQQAQEKIVEEIIRKPDDDDGAYAYFDVFLNLPPRSLKDYYQVIKDPLSLKKLQKLVRGIHGRGKDVSGISDFKTWAALEEKASLIWQNAYYYNEDGSEIANLAKYLEKFFRKQLNEAKAVVAEPQQTKIRVRKPEPAEQAGSSARPKKITIHVARGSSASSPAPPTAGSMSSEGGNSSAARPLNPSQAAPPGHAQLDRTLSVSGSAPSPSPSMAGMKAEEGARQSPAAPRPNGLSPHAVNGSPAHGPGYSGAGPQGPFTNAQLQNGHAPAAPAPVVPPRESKVRLPGRAPLLNKVTVRTHPAIVKDRRFQLNILPHPNETQQSVTIAVPAGNWKQQIVVSMTPSIQEQNRHYKMFVIANGHILLPAVPVMNDPIDPGSKLYEASLHTGINNIQIQIIAALPKGEKLSNGSEVEFEKLTLLANLMRH